MNPYSHVHNFNLHGDQEEVMKNVKEFSELGWIIIGEIAIVGAPFYSVAWPRDKGQPIYPPSYRAQE